MEKHHSIILQKLLLHKQHLMSQGTVMQGHLVFGHPHSWTLQVNCLVQMGEHNLSSLFNDISS
jgi:hypothetical protein